MVLGLLGEFGAIGPTCDAGGGAEPSSTPITDSGGGLGLVLVIVLILVLLGKL